MDWPPENPSNVVGLCQTYKFNHRFSHQCGE
jgi:hypothetical protein